jgi:hypothetical protein
MVLVSTVSALLTPLAVLLRAKFTMYVFGSNPLRETLGQHTSAGHTSLFFAYFEEFLEWHTLTLF